MGVLSTSTALFTNSLIENNDFPRTSFPASDNDFALLLEKLDLSDCSGLVMLKCHSNSITELNLSAMSSLKTLACEVNSLGSLNLEDLTNLTTITCNGQIIYGAELSERINMKDFAGSKFEKVSGVLGYDENGKELLTSYDSGTGTAEFSGVPLVVRYNYDTGAKNASGDVIYMDVSVTSLNPSSDDANGRLGHSGGGCDVGIEILGLIALILMFRFMLQK